MDQKIKLLNSPVQGWSQPIMINFNIQSDVLVYEKLKSEGRIDRVSDEIRVAIEELYHIDRPSEIDSIDKNNLEKYTSSFGSGQLDNYGIWVFYPWSGTLVHFPERDDLRRLRGSRNRNLINDDERTILVSDKTVLVAGLSVGSNIVDSLLMQGIGSKYILVDMDQLDPTNLNRIRASYDQLGIHKVDVVSKKISELDPFIEQIHYKEGLNEKNLDEIIEHHSPDIIVDEMDSLRMKIVLRLQARKQGIAVLMATDDGDDIILDIERYDRDSDQPILHGLLPDQIIDKIIEGGQMSRSQSGAIIGKYFVGLENVPVRMIESLLEVGKTLPSWPQLGGAAVLSGLYVAYAARKILLDQPINSGRFLMGPEDQLNPIISTSEYLEQKDNLIGQMHGRS